MQSKVFFALNKNDFLTKMIKNIVFSQILAFFVSIYVISMLWDVCRSKIGDVENSFLIHHIFESLQPRGCSWRGYATQEADQELKWKLRTLSVWEIWVLEFLEPQSWDTRVSDLKQYWLRVVFISTLIFYESNAVTYKHNCIFYMYIPLFTGKLSTTHNSIIQCMFYQSLFWDHISF